MNLGYRNALLNLQSNAASIAEMIRAEAMLLAMR